MNIFFGVIVGLIILMLLVVAHEFGHFIVARRNGVNVTEFGIGFPPRTVAWRKDPKTGKWHYLPRKKWAKDGINRVVYSNAKEENEIAAEVESTAEAEEKAKKESTKNAEITDRHDIAVKKRGLARIFGRRENSTKRQKVEYCQKGMIFSLNWLPIGGFCQMDGETNSAERKGTFGAASFWSKTKILFAGVAMNWLVAAVILTILAWTGMPEIIPGQFSVPVDTRKVAETPVQISNVIEGSPASEAGLEAGDYIIAIDGQEMHTASQIKEFDNSHAGETVKFEVRRGSENGEGGEVLEKEVKLNNNDTEYVVGITMLSSEVKSYSTWSAPIVGVGLTAQLTGETFRGMGELVGNLVSGAGSQLSFDASVRESGQEKIEEAGDSVSGPVGIVGQLFPAVVVAGPTRLALLTAIISISLACMNVLPIPALDGGRWFLIAFFHWRHKKLTAEIEEKVVSRAFLVLLVLIVAVTILDITRIAQR